MFQIEISKCEQTIMIKSYKINIVEKNKKYVYIHARACTYICYSVLLVCNRNSMYILIALSTSKNYQFVKKHTMQIF